MKKCICTTEEWRANVGSSDRDVKGLLASAKGRIEYQKRLHLYALWLAHAFRHATHQRRKMVGGGARVDILIQIARGCSPIAKNAGRVVFQHSLERSLIRIENVADFEVSAGRQIRVWPAARSTQKDIEIYLFGPAWATLCHQRGILPLHASAIVTGGGITAFAGHSGVGKSSLAASMSSLDYELVADDILPISFNQNSVPGAWPYLRRLKLKSDSIIELALTAIEPVSETLDKTKYFVLPKYSGRRQVEQARAALCARNRPD